MATLSPPSRFRRNLLSTCAMVATVTFLAPALAQSNIMAEEEMQELEGVTVSHTAEDQLRQAVGVSLITEQDIIDHPPANDLAELIRTMPGVNLTGASSSGAYGNQRQIDLRGMGPENTLILIDGKPVQSRNAAMMRRTGERNTRGDSNWVPVSAIESIEVLRGPAAARYGSGAAGGVVNIITKRPTDTFSGEATIYYRDPQSSDEGDTRRLGFNLSGPIAEQLSFRLYGNIAKTDRDSFNINAGHSEQPDPPAGREGVRNRDIDGLLRWDLTPDQVLEFEAGISRQGNIYTGERFNQDELGNLQQEMTERGAETNRILRRTAGVTHRARWNDTVSSRAIYQYEETNRRYLGEGSAGRFEGAFDEEEGWNTSEVKNHYLNGEAYTSLSLGGLNHLVTTGLEFRREELSDPGSENVTPPAGFERSNGGRTHSNTWAAYIEDNVALTSALILTPALRLDHQSNIGNTWSPGLNASYMLTDEWTLNAGIAKAYKAPNLYQSNPDYWYTTMGMGCPLGIPGPCHIQGNPDLKAETSINTEVGVAWTNHQGWDASLAAFDNHYKNKIVADMAQQTPEVPPPGTAYYLYRWTNASKAQVRGLEGSLNVPLLGTQGSVLNLVNNATWMDRNRNKETREPLAVIPKYTINSTLNWRMNNQWSTHLTGTIYGRQDARTLGLRGQTLTNEGLGSYTLLGWRTNWQMDSNLRLGFGIENLTNKRLFRTANSEAAGAQSYNEPGRAYYVTLTGSF